MPMESRIELKLNEATHHLVVIYRHSKPSQLDSTRDIQDRLSLAGIHSFVAEMVGYVAKLPVWPLPTKIQIKPIDVGEVADIIVNYTTLEASGRIDPIGGPQIHSVGELAQVYRDSRGLRRPIIRFPILSKTVAAFRTGHAICPDHMIGRVTWEEWLVNRYTSGADETDSRVQSPMCPLMERH